MVRQLARMSSILLLSTYACAYIDNPILFPFHERLSWRTNDKLSRMSSSIFFMTADEARNCDGAPIDLPDIGGCFDLAYLNKAMNMVGITNPLYLSEWSTLELPYSSYGKLRTTGIDFMLEYAISKKFSVGAALSLMHVHGRCDYCITGKAKTNVAIINGNEVYPGYEFELERARLNANNLLGINAGEWGHTGLSDLELFVRYGTIKDFLWKFKQVDLNAMLGLVLPTGIRRNIYSPASVAVGGNGHTGIYGQLEGECELTDDLFLGLWLNLSKRFSKVQVHRMPMDREALSFGVLVDRALVNSGFTIGVSPYIIFDDIQDGFGAYFGYAYVYHFQDKWNYSGLYTPKLARLREVSNWINEFFTIGIDYDTTKTPRIREYGPRVFFEWTIPTDIFSSRWVAKTHRISLGIEFHF